MHALAYGGYIVVNFLSQVIFVFPQIKKLRQIHIKVSDMKRHPFFLEREKSLGIRLMVSDLALNT